jgi:thioredoxin
MNFWITQFALFSLSLGSTNSFAPAVSTPQCQHCRQSPVGESHLFQSTIAIPEERYVSDDSSRVSKRKVRVSKSNFQNAYTPPKTTVPTKDNGVDMEEQLTILRSKSLKELKLACSRRNIQYGKFSETGEYIQAIWEDMQKAFEFSVTGMVQPGAMVELMGDQIDLEMTRKDTLILVDVFAPWCGPCRVIVPELQVAARKLMEDKVRVVKIDADKNPSWAGRYQVEGLPALLLIKEGHVVDRLEGAHTSNEITSFVQQHMV